MQHPSRLIAVSGAAYLAAMIALAWTEARLGTPLFFVCAGIGAVAYAAVLALIWRAPEHRRRLFVIAILLAAAFRVPVIIRPVNPDNDMIRYIWDGRVQKLGLNPYAVRPADPAVAFTHTDETRNMPSAR